MFARSIFLITRKISHSSIAKNQGSDIIKVSQTYFLSNKVNLNRDIAPTETNPETGEIKKKKTAIIPKITLLTGNDVTVSTLEEAQKLAKRRDLKLVKIVDLDTKTERPVYKLMTGAEYHEEDLKQRERKKTEKQKGFKGEKVLILSQNISEHDLQTNVNKILKWIVKRYEVRIIINGNAENNKKAENVYSIIEKNIAAQGRLVQKRQKGSDIKFQVLPPKEPKNIDNDQRHEGKPI